LEETLELKGHHRVHILNGGTEILQFIPNDDDDTNDCSHISKPP
jgi:manganese-transporting P-type ATPase